MAVTIRVLMAQRGKQPRDMWGKGISRSRWYRLMKEPSTATVKELASIAEELGTTPAALLGESAAA